MDVNLLKLLGIIVDSNIITLDNFSYSIFDLTGFLGGVFGNLQLYLVQKSIIVRSYK